MKKIMSKKNGFTLIELIVVIAILAILAAIAIPSITGYIEEAKRAADVTDASNIMDATKIAVLTTAHGFPEDHYLEVVWACGVLNANNSYTARLFIRNPRRTSVFDSDADLTSLDVSAESYKVVADAMFNYLGASDVTLLNNTSYGRGYTAQINDAKSIAGNENSFAFHINVSTGEIVLAYWPREDVNAWVDFGLDLEKAPY